MHDKSDAQLLREYADHGDQAAFREIVTRHMDVLYSSALRQVGSPDLARDVAQSVFTDLARKAPSLARTLDANASLLGWLYRSTRFAALNQLREDRRRQNREKQAMQHLESAPETTPEWEHLRPVLDEAMLGLGDEDREALLLRFFKHHDFRSIGRSLGVSDDAAQKRVSRALEKLREHLTRRGVTATVTALATSISTNAVTAAPTGLAATLSTGALAGTTIAATITATSTATATATATATKAIAMTTLQKTVIGVTLTAAIGVGIYEARQASKFSDQNRLLAQQQSILDERVRQSNRERDAAAEAIATLRAENARLNRNIEDLPRLRGELARLQSASEELAKIKASSQQAANDPAEIAATAWLARKDSLKLWLNRTPNQRIPELQFATDEDWLAASKGKLESEEDYRRAMSNLRNGVEQRFANSLRSALENYMDANGGQFPTEVSQLRSYFNPPVDESILQRYAVLPKVALPSVVMGGEWIISTREPVDAEFDRRIGIGPNGWGQSAGPHAWQKSPALEIAETLDPVLKAFSSANGGREPNEIADLLPYLRTPEQQAAYDRVLRNTQATQESSHE